MARESTGGTMIESRNQLVATLESGAKPSADWRIGTEHEKFAFRVEDLSPVPYEGPSGVCSLLEAMSGLLGWDVMLEEGRPIGLVDPLGMSAVTLEPGGQIELAGAPHETIHQTCRELNAHHAQLRECADALGISFLGIGFSPLWGLSETPVMPKERYRIMRDYMMRVSTPVPGSIGGHDHPAGLDMMFRTCSVQANLDFADEADMRVKMRVASALQPIATALFANSPFSDGKPSGFRSYRSEVWRYTDPARTGILPFVFDRGFGFEAYVDWALDVPLYFVKRGDTLHPCAGATFRDLMAGRLESLPGEQVTMSDWYNHLSTLFPEVRLKKFIEMRGADAGPWGEVCAVPALWVGLLYDADILQGASDLTSGWATNDILALRDAVPREGLHARIADRSVLEIATDMLSLAEEGLRKRAHLSPRGKDETMYLQPLWETTRSGQSPADRHLEAFRTEWNGDVRPIFGRMAF